MFAAGRDAAQRNGAMQHIVLYAIHETEVKEGSVKLDRKKVLEERLFHPPTIVKILRIVGLSLLALLFLQKNA